LTSQANPHSLYNRAMKTLRIVLDDEAQAVLDQLVLHLGMRPSQVLRESLRLICLRHAAWNAPCSKANPMRTDFSVN
jgi:hypothetical protein